MAETFAETETNVYWDVEDCKLPDGYNAASISRNLRSALDQVNYHGPISILAYGDIRSIPEKILLSFASVGITIKHITDGKDSRVKHMIMDMLSSGLSSPPRNFLLIAKDDVGFFTAFDQLQRKGHNTLLAQPQEDTPQFSLVVKLICPLKSLDENGPKDLCIQ